ncbi:MAG: hypothetical protein NT145_00100 [Elusimicrobia bacterium]|nr:hypothetical protein [Elusimicrobiota bacterium]
MKRKLLIRLLISMTVLCAGLTSIYAGVKTDYVESTYGIKTSTIQITNGAAAGRFLGSDGSGNATWQSVPAGVSDHAQLTSTGTLTHTQLENDLISVGVATGTLGTDLTAETDNRISADNSIGVATGTLRTDLTAETNARIGSDNTIGIATATLRTDVDAKVSKAGDTMTGTLNAPDVNVTYGVIAATLQVTNGAGAGKVLTSDTGGNATWQSVPAGVSDHGQLTSTGTLTHTQLENDLISVGVATGTLRTDLSNETNSRISADNSIGIATGTLRTDITALQTSTGTFVKKTGDTMTGNLTTPNLTVNYGIVTSTFVANSTSNFNSDVIISSSAASYMGDPGTDGTWKVQRSGNDLVYSRRESGSYVEKYRAIP